MHIHEASAQQVTHPILIVAAVAVVLFCSVGTAAILGWLPSSSGSGYQPVPAISRPAPAVLPAPQAPAAPAQPLQAGTEPMLAQQAAAPVMLAAAQPPAPVADPAQPPAAQPAAPAPHCGNCGVIAAIHEVHTRGQGSGLGAAGGAVLGGLLGNQVGSGHGRQLATIAGAVGGAVAGNQIEGNMKSSHSYNVVVRMDDGRTRTVHLKSLQNWRAGDPVRIVNGTLRAAPH
ncbi:glycine zipper 2TM domain-containing protein [Duganella sp. LX20W]|uniref:Glycine zipper 2TM domain-containing protein n=1 Tax=Rugamonas brunnea TaxID=2758569 RepID=A0A7W2EP53_9BURK|nr:glycine zipper 2TM domain-containing protein [Rugamonas brunnea]MBA5636047.1 glycine zipper 2TM domain-containing protein [Rugamonas brunnea]